MKNTCPKCGTAYAVNAGVIGRAFTCKNCGSALIVAEEGLTYKDAAPAAPPAPPAAPAASAAPAPEPTGAAFNFDDEPAPRDDDGGRKKRDKKDRDRDRDDRDRDRDDRDDDRPAKGKRSRRRDDEDDDDFAPPPRAARRRGGADEDGYVPFAYFAPKALPVAFWVIAALITILGLLEAYEVSQVARAINAIIVALAIPIKLFILRVGFEAVHVLFRIFHRLGEIKDALKEREPKP